MTVVLANGSKLSLRTTVWHHICSMLIENHEAIKNVFIFNYTNKVWKKTIIRLFCEKSMNYPIFAKILYFKRKLWEMVFSVLCPHLGLTSLETIHPFNSPYFFAGKIIKHGPLSTFWTGERYVFPLVQFKIKTEMDRYLQHILEQLFGHFQRNSAKVLMD